MKTLKFTPELCEQILEGSKTSTWRLFDDKDIRTNDDLAFVNKATGEIIGVAEVMAVKIKTLGTIEEEDWEGHEQYGSVEEMLKAYRQYYGEGVSLETELKIINFTFQATSH